MFKNNDFIKENKKSNVADLEVERIEVNHVDEKVTPCFIQAFFKVYCDEFISVDEILGLALQGFIDSEIFFTAPINYNTVVKNYFVNRGFSDELKACLCKIKAFSHYDIAKVAIYLEVKKMLDGLGVVWDKFPYACIAFGPMEEALMDFAFGGEIKCSLMEFLDASHIGVCGGGSVTAAVVPNSNEKFKLVVVCLALIEMFVYGWATKKNYTACIEFIQKYISALPNGKEILNSKKDFYKERQVKNLSNSPLCSANKGKRKNVQKLLRGMQKSELLRAYIEFAHFFDNGLGCIAELMRIALPSVGEKINIKLDNITVFDIYKVGYSDNKLLNIFG